MLVSIGAADSFQKLNYGGLNTAIFLTSQAVLLQNDRLQRAQKQCQRRLLTLVICHMVTVRVRVKVMISVSVRIVSNAVCRDLSAATQPRSVPISRVLGVRLLYTVVGSFLRRSQNCPY